MNSLATFTKIPCSIDFLEPLIGKSIPIEIASVVQSSQSWSTKNILQLEPFVITRDSRGCQIQRRPSTLAVNRTHFSTDNEEQ